jgi:hypothetical protein
MATNQTIESPNLGKINKEAGQFTADAINTLWSALNATRADQRRLVRLATDKVAPKKLSLAPTTTVSDLDLEGASVVSFEGSTAVNFTGMRAPETGEVRIVFVQVNGSGTITAKNELTSEAANRLTHASGADVTLASAAGIVYVYLNGRWREVA